jgi:hypothetical protein
VKYLTNSNLRVNVQTNQPLAAVPYQQLTSTVAGVTSADRVATNDAAYLAALTNAADSSSITWTRDGRSVTGAVVWTANPSNAVLQAAIDGKAATNANVSGFANDAGYVTQTITNTLAATNGTYSGMSVGTATFATSAGTATFAVSAAFATNWTGAAVLSNFFLAQGWITGVTLTNTGDQAGIVNGSGDTWGIGTTQTASADMTWTNGAATTSTTTGLIVSNGLVMAWNPALVFGLTDFGDGNWDSETNLVEAAPVFVGNTVVRGRSVAIGGGSLTFSIAVAATGTPSTVSYYLATNQVADADGEAITFITNSVPAGHDVLVITPASAASGTVNQFGLRLDGN